ncbi:MAG TPA: hypothetical protein VIK32_04655 [Candidatus Limnocylindrales bacterium]
MTDAITRHLGLMATDAHTRSFGVRDRSQTQALIRHGYLLCLEEVERALDDHVRDPDPSDDPPRLLHLKTTSGPRDAA